MCRARRDLPIYRRNSVNQVRKEIEKHLVESRMRSPIKVKQL